MLFNMDFREDMKMMIFYHSCKNNYISKYIINIL